MFSADGIRRLLQRLVPAVRPLVPHAVDGQMQGPPDRPAPSHPTAAAFWSTPDGTPVDSMDAGQLAAWENRNAPSVERTSDAAEPIADEKQDGTTSLNFPLHWTTAAESWNYLFDFAIACELLAPRPDDLVLDFAAGTCWASEFLTRLGVRTVSIDLSAEMLRRGRQRLAADARLIFRDQASFVAARGQSLPFANDTFEGVLCMNALHHLPSYADTLREIHRVLKPGGRAVFSEPGTSHASEPHSRFRMREENVLEKSVCLPIVRRLAIDAGFTRMRIVPLRSPSVYAFDYSASPDDLGPLIEMWNETIRLGPGEHSRFVLSKGDDAPADTLLPSQQLAGRLQARIEALHVTETVPSGMAFTDRLRIVNTGSVTWKARGRRFGGQVTCGLKVMNPAGEMVREDLGRTPLPRDLAPGDIIELDIAVAGTLPPGRYELRYDMVVEGVTWFEFHGSPCVQRGLNVSD